MASARSAACGTDLLLSTPCRTAMRPSTAISKPRTAAHRQQLRRGAAPLAAVARDGDGAPAAVLASRRSLLSQTLLAAAVGVAATTGSAQPALAFGSGFPGYDVNLDGRKRALERNKREMQAELDRAAAYRAKLAADKAVKAATPASTPPPAAQ